MNYEVENLEKLAVMMGFDHSDVIMFENLTADETLEALVYGLCLLVFTIAGFSVKFTKGSIMF